MAERGGPANSFKTVEPHVSRIFSKLGLTPTRSEHRRVMAILSHLHARNGERNQG